MNIIVMFLLLVEKMLCSFLEELSIIKISLALLSYRIVIFGIIWKKLFYFIISKILVSKVN